MTREREQFLFGPFLGEVIEPSIPYSIRRARFWRIAATLCALALVVGGLWGLSWGV